MMKRSAWLWRLRRNPLRRRSYAVQAWAFLAVGLVATAQARADAIGSRVALAILSGALLGCGTTAELLDRRRAAQWAAEWAAVGPQWDHRDA